MKSYHREILDMSIKDLEIFVSAIYGPDDIVELRLLAKGQKSVQKWMNACELLQYYPVLTDYNQKGYNIYAGVNPRKKHQVSGDDNVLLARCLFADFDGIEPLDGCGRWEVVSDRIFQADLPQPDLIIHSGHGIHTYWMIQEPLADLDLWRSTQHQMNLGIQADICVKNPERIMRLPGFLNVKTEPHTECFIVIGNR